MSSTNVIPMLSSSPPPMNEAIPGLDDTFGDFEDAAEFSFEAADGTSGNINDSNEIIVDDHQCDNNISNDKSNSIKISEDYNNDEKSTTFNIDSNILENGNKLIPGKEAEFKEKPAKVESRIEILSNGDSDSQCDNNNYSNQQPQEIPSSVDDAGKDCATPEESIDLGALHDVLLTETDKPLDSTNTETGDNGHLENTLKQNGAQSSNVNGNDQIEFVTNGNVETFENDDFGDFSTFDSKINEDDDNFGDFSCVDNSESNSINLPVDAEKTPDMLDDESKCCKPIDVKLSGENDAFADFSDFESADPECANCPSESSDCFEFADFTSNQDFDDFENAPDDEWAADFQSVDFCQTNSQENLSAIEIITSAFLSKKLNVGVQESEEHTSEENILFDSEIFKKLETFESSSVNLQWPTLKSNNCLLKALEIDSRNIIFGKNKNQTIPLFAANLGLLEPMKFTESMKKVDSVENQDSQSLATSPTQVDNIPPVQFDWSVSGLTNPLESTSTSVLLDVDIFCSDTTTEITKSVSKSSSLEDEFLSSPEPCIQSSSSSLLDKLMSSVKKTTYIPQYTEKKRPPGLSDEAKDILDELVPLSFMNAKVLMFPVSESPDNS